jgi:hypothetical protein
MNYERSMSFSHQTKLQKTKAIACLCPEEQTESSQNDIEGEAK